MFSFSQSSENKLLNLHDSLVKVARSVIQVMDFAVICTSRSLEEQEDLIEKGLSKTISSKHLYKPKSWAIDIAPYYSWKDPKINWNDTNAFIYLAGIWMGHAFLQGVKCRWGGDWNTNHDLSDQTFFDLGHFELISED